MQRVLFIFFWISVLSSACVSRKKLLEQHYYDRFDSLNVQFWQLSGHTFKNNQAYFNPGNFKISDGKLILKVTADSLKHKPFSAAELRTKQVFKYGRFTVRMKAAKGSGMVSAFFLYDPEGPNHQEIDIEFTGQNTSQIHLNYWVNEKSHVKTLDLGFDASADFHEYTITWLPKEIIWEVDGSEVHRAAGNIPSEKMHLLFNIWPSYPNDWAGSFHPKILPCRAEIDHVEIYSR